MRVSSRGYPHAYLPLTLPSFVCVLFVQHNRIQALRNTAEACVSVCVLTLCVFVSRYRPRTYCLADSDEESSSAGSSDEEGSSELSNDSAGAEG